MDDLHSINEAINKRAGRRLFPSIAVSLLLVAVIFLSLLFERWLFAALICVAIAFGVKELAHAYRAAGIKVSTLQLTVATTVLLVATWIGGVAGLAVATAITLPILLFFILVGGTVDFVKKITGATFVLFYLGYLAGFVLLLARPHDGLERVGTLVILVGCNDTFAYIFGVLFGKHPLAKSISPKKTWEGFIGGVVFTAAGGALAFHYFLGDNPWIGAAVGLLAVITATAGDLIESGVKRDLSLKDMGDLLPGHGGMLDRIDSALLTAPMLWSVLELIKRFG